LTSTHSLHSVPFLFFFNAPATPEIYTLSLHDALPIFSLPSPHFYGAVEDQDVCWLFIREVQGEKYDVDRPDHRAAAAQWLGLLHTEAPSVARRAGLPDAGPGRYRDQMRATRDAVRNHLDNPAFGNGDLAFLDRLLEQFDDLDEH